MRSGQPVSGAGRSGPTLTSSSALRLQALLLALSVCSALALVGPASATAQEQQGAARAAQPSPAPLFGGRSAPLATPIPESTRPASGPATKPQATPTPTPTPGPAGKPEATSADKPQGTAVPEAAGTPTPTRGGSSAQPASAPPTPTARVARATATPEPTPELESDAEPEPDVETPAPASPGGLFAPRGLFTVASPTPGPAGTPGATPAGTPGATSSPSPSPSPTATPAPAPRFGTLAAGRRRPDPPTWSRTPPPVEADVLDAYLAQRGSPLAGLGAALLNVGWRYNIDPRLLVAIAGADTGFGRVLCTDFNAWNWFWWEWCNSPFESWEQAMDEVARGLRLYYLDAGLTDVDAIANRYGPLDDPRDTLGLNRHWPGNVTRYLEALGGSRCNLTWVRTDGPCAPPRPTATPRPSTGQPGDEELAGEMEEWGGEEERGGEQDEEAVLAEAGDESDLAESDGAEEWTMSWEDLLSADWSITGVRPRLHEPVGNEDREDLAARQPRDDGPGRPTSEEVALDDAALSVADEPEPGAPDEGDAFLSIPDRSDLLVGGLLALLIVAASATRLGIAARLRIAARPVVAVLPRVGPVVRVVERLRAPW